MAGSQDNDITITAKATSPSQTIAEKPATPTDTVVAKGTSPTQSVVEKPYTILLLAEDLTELAAEDGVSLQAEGYGQP
jgi:hypothetical protein